MSDDLAYNDLLEKINCLVQTQSDFLHPQVEDELSDLLTSSTDYCQLTDLVDKLNLVCMMLRRGVDTHSASLLKEVLGIVNEDQLCDYISFDWSIIDSIEKGAYIEKCQNEDEENDAANLEDIDKDCDNVYEEEVLKLMNITY